MSTAIHVDCDGDGCRERWNAANTNEDRRLATGHFTTAEDVAVDLEHDPIFYVDAWVTLPEGWTTARDPVRFFCPACVSVRDAK